MKSLPLILLSITLILGCFAQNGLAQEKTSNTTVTLGNSETGKEYCSLRDADEFLSFNNYIISCYGLYGGKAKLRIFDQDLKNIYDETIKLPESISKGSVHSAIVFQEKFFLILSGSSDAVSEGNKGVFLWEFNPSDFTFKTPILTEQFPVSGTVESMIINRSANGEFLSLVLEPKVKCDDYSLNILVLDKTLGVALAGKDESGQFEACMRFNTTFLSNTGELFLMFDESTGLHSRNTFQNPNTYAACIAYNNSPDEIVMHIQYTDRNLLAYNFVEENSKTSLYFSWYYKEDSKRSGFSLFNLEDGTEKIIHEFDPAWVEPYLRLFLPGENYDDMTENKSPANTVNARYSLLAIVKHAGNTTYVIEKSTPFEIVYASSGNTDHITVPYEGDIMLLQYAETGELTAKAKIEKATFNRIVPRGTLLWMDESTLNLVYCSKPVEIEGPNKIGSMPINRIMPDQVLFKTTVDLSTLELQTTQYEAYAKGGKDYGTKVLLSTAVRTADDFVVRVSSDSESKLIRTTF